MIEINSTDYTKYGVYPIKKQFTLDESLNQGVLTLKNMAKNEPFEPLDEMSIDSEEWLIGTDNLTQKTFGLNDKFQHDITMLEKAKELEKYYVDSCTFTNPLLKQYLNNPVAAPLRYLSLEEIATISPTVDDTWDINNTSYTSDPNSNATQTPKEVGSSFTISSIRQILNLPESGIGALNYFDLKVYDPNDDLVDSIHVYVESNASDLNTTISITNAIKGDYKIYCTWYYTYSGTKDCSGIFTSITVLTDTSEIDDITITDVINRLLTITETQRYGETPRFIFNSEQATTYDNILAPEFAFTKMNLFEALKQVGSYIHGIPELNGNEISFKILGQREYANIVGEKVGYTATQSIEQFCSEIDTNVDNLINIDDEQSGTIIEPYYAGLITPRIDTGTAIITEATGFIQTSKPIEKIIKVEIGYMHDNIYVGDITQYIYEQSEYATLSSYESVFPFSKAYALYYKQGSNNIYGLNFKEEDAISPIFQKYSIYNIIDNVTGGSYNTTDDPLLKIQFRITYIPIESARIKQRKSNLNSTTKKAVLAYNQSANKVDTDYYGENLKGVVERLGNIEKVYTYICKKTDTLPEVGQLFDDDYYISVIKTEEYANYIKYSLGLSKDFNRWNEYVGVNNNQRFYEVSEKQALDRYVVYEDYLVISDNYAIETNDYEKTISYNLIELLKQNFIPNAYTYGYLTFIQAKTLDEDLELINGFTLPAFSFAFGNSSCYGFSAIDNYGVGNKISKFLTDAKATEEEVVYGDNYGKAKYIDFAGGFEFYTSPDSYDTAVLYGKSIPQLYSSDFSTFSNLFKTTGYPIKLEKDSREIIHFTYQIHCVTDRNDLIVGSGLSKKLGIRKGYIDETSLKGEYVDIYVMDREIGKFEKEITDLPDSLMRISYTMTSDSTNKKLDFGEITLNANGKSIVLVDRNSSELIFAINGDFTENDTYQLPSLNFRHKLAV